MTRRDLQVACLRRSGLNEVCLMWFYKWSILDDVVFGRKKSFRSCSQDI